MNDRNKLIDDLNEVLTRAFDAKDGYHEVYNATDSIRLKKAFHKLESQRAQFIIDLRNEITLLGGEPVDSGSIAGGLHRTWLQFKSDITDQTDEVVIEECIRGEESAIESYEELSTRPSTPKSTIKLLSNQLSTIRSVAAALEYDPVLTA